MILAILTKDGIYWNPLRNLQKKLGNRAWGLDRHQSGLGSSEPTRGQGVGRVCLYTIISAPGNDIIANWPHLWKSFAKDIKLRGRNFTGCTCQLLQRGSKKHDHNMVVIP